MPQVVEGYNIDLERVEETLASLDGNVDALSLLTESVGRPELSNALRYVVQILGEHHTTLKWHLGFPLSRNVCGVAAQIEGVAHV